MPTAGPIVAVLDDEPEMRKALRRLFTCHGFRVEEYERGEHLLAVVDSQTMAFLFAADDPRGRLPGFRMPRTGLNPWDVSIDMAPKLEPYGLTVPMWYCPVRPADFIDAQTWYRSRNPGQSLTKFEDSRT
jgi:CheY-like chemotaxis protein